MPERTIAIGDVHGCVQALDALLDAIQPSAEDRIITLGDYIDRGPASRSVIDRLIQLSETCDLVTLLGNHEVMLMMARDNGEESDFWLQCGGQETLDSYGGAPESIPEEHIQFIKQCRLTYETDTHIFLHANYHADASLEDQPEYALLWKHLSLEIPAPHQSGKTAVVGHTPQLNGIILDAGHVICIDTFCVGGGWLTALEVNTRQVWQADRDGNMRPAD